MKMILVIKEGADATTVGLLSEAADKLGVEIVPVDYTQPLPELDPAEKYLMYRVAPGSLQVGRTLNQKYLCVSFENTEYGFSREAALELAGVPTPPTEIVKSLEPEELARQVERVGGFPLVIKDKIAGGHGVGIVKAETMDNLHSIGRLIFDTGAKKEFRIQQFLRHSRHARLIVLGDQVIDSVAYNANDYDFRTNRSDDEIHAEPMQFGAEIERTAILATRANGYEFGGVDIIIDGDGHWVLEVNHPCYFPRAQLTTGVPTSEKMIEYLLAKAEPGPARRAATKQYQPGPSLVLLTRPGRNVILDAFQKVARHLAMPVIPVNPADTDAGLDEDGRYLLYRISPHLPARVRGREIELYQQYDCTSFAGDYPVLASREYRRNPHYIQAGLDFVAKVPVTRKTPEYLQERIEEVGGFPVVVIPGGAKNSSIVRVDSFETFISLVDYLRALRQKLLIQPFVDVKHYGRLVVLGDGVISSTEYLSTNADGYPFQNYDAVLPRQYGEAVQSLAVSAARSHELECAAVNVLMDGSGAAFVEDVIFPFNFRVDQDATGVNIAERMLRHLLDRYADTHD